jgi:hypothetical protein
MKKIENFLYNDIVLYSKGWFQSKEDIVWKDLAYFFSKIYAFPPKNESEVALLMLLVLEKIHQKLELDRDPEKVSARWLSTPYRLEQEIRRIMLLYDYDRDRATIQAVLHVLHTLSNDEIKLKRPVYSKKFPFRLGGYFTKYPISMTYAEMNKKAIKMFGE